MQGDLEKEKPNTSKVTAKNKNNVKPSGTLNQLKTKRDSSRVRQESDPQTKRINNSRQASSSSSRSSKPTVPKYGIENKGAGGKVGGTPEKQPFASPSSKTLPQSMGTKDRAVLRRVSTIKESSPMLNKKLSERSVPAPSRTGVRDVAKSNVLHQKRTVDKKDQNVKFKGGGSSAPPRSDASSKNLRPKDDLKPPMPKVTEVKNSVTGGKASSVGSAKKRVESAERDFGKKKVAPLQASVKNSMKEKSDSRMKENLKRIMSEHVRKPKEENLPLKTPKVGNSMSVKPSANVSFSEESASKRGRERTRTWTISSSGNNTTERVSNSSENDGNCDNLKLSSVLDLSSQHKGGDDEPSAERATSMSRAHTVGVVKTSAKARASTSSNVSATQLDHAKSLKSTGKEQGAVVDGNADEETGLCHGGAVDEYEYEDDFEDYESDFEEYTEEDDDEEGASEVSSDGSENSESESDESHEREVENAVTEVGAKNIKIDGAEVEGATSMKEDEEDCERKMDSGLYDSGRKKRPEEDFSPLKLLRVDADEGFDEREEVAKDQDQKWEGPAKEVTLPISFCTNCEVFFTKKSPPAKEVTKKALERGRKLLQMITLDEMSYSLFDLPSIPYDAFMKYRGHVNTKQISTQTNEDSHSEGTQTDSIVMVDQWTQKPPVISLSLKENAEFHPQLLDNNSWIRLGRFMESAGEVMSILLEEQWNNCTSVPNGRSVSSPLSKMSFKLGQSGSSNTIWEVMLASRPVVCVCFCKTRSNLLLCCHGPPNNAQERVQVDEAVGNNLGIGSQSSLLSVWSVSEPSCPYKLLCCQGVVTRACFQEGIADFGQIVLAGCEDGSICVWDVYERGGSHVEIPILERGSKKALCPMFTTHGDETHLGRVVGLEPILGSDFGDVDGEKASSNRAKVANQVCSLDEWGVILVWSVIRRGGSKKIGWVSLVPSMKVCLAETNWNKYENSLFPECEDSPSERLSSEVNDVALWNALAVDSDWILAASDTGSVVCLPVDGEQRSMKVYPGLKDSLASAESIVVNPQGLPFFMVGNFVGQVHLFSHSSKRHFGSWEPPPSSLPSAIVKLAWSPQRPFVFFTVDSLSRIHVWDLASSDIFPLASLPPPKVGKITDISLSCPKGDSPAYMVVGMNNGEVVLHHLREELTSGSHEVRRKELTQFIKYANLL